MRKAESEVPDQPMVPDESIRRLRAILILEEALETVKALGFDIASIHYRNPQGYQPRASLGFDFDNWQVGYWNVPPDLVEIADGCADISVVTIGTLSACGIADEAILEEVDLNNLAKFGLGGYRRADGKWIKPAGHQPPDIQALLKSQTLISEEVSSD